MRRALLIAAGGAAIALLLGFAAFSRTTSHGSKPSLRITRATPLIVQGRHFRASELVRLTSGSRTARAKASGSGSFVITIPGANRCNTVRVVARGTAGSYAIVKLLPAPMCAPVRSSGSRS
jgi:predicted RNA-binding protein with TRAM domain